MAALEIFDIYFYKYLKRTAKCCGCNFFDSDFRVTIHTALFAGSMVFGMICLSYTLATRDFDTALNSLFGWGIVLQGFIKYITVIVNAQQINSKVKYLRTIFVSVGKSATDKHVILFKWSKRFLFLIKLFSAMISIPFLLFCMFPVVLYYMTAQLVVLLPVFVPFVDETTVSGYFVLTSIHTLWSVQSTIGLIGADVLMAFLFLHILPMVELIELCFAEMNEVSKLQRTAFNNILLKMQLRNILQMHKELTE